MFLRILKCMLNDEIVLKSKEQGRLQSVALFNENKCLKVGTFPLQRMQLYRRHFLQVTFHSFWTRGK